ncbi:MAG: hypothetical protein WCS65_01595 [Verrucomicrobiae bacterium]
MNKPSPFSKTTKQLRENLSAAMIKAGCRGRQFALSAGAADDPDLSEAETTESSRNAGG